MDELSNCHLISSRSNGLFKSRLAFNASPSSCLIDTWGRMAMHGAGHWCSSRSEVKNLAICVSTL